MNGQVVITVANCDRCGGYHNSLEFAEFKRPWFVNGTYFNYWALCPSTHEPIAVVVAPDRAAEDRLTTRPLG